MACGEALSATFMFEANGGTGHNLSIEKRHASTNVRGTHKFMTYHTVFDLSCMSFSVLTALAIPEYSYPEKFIH